MPSGRIGAPFAIGKFGRLRPLKSCAIGHKTFADAGNNRRNLLRKPAMSGGVFRALTVEIEVEFNRARAPVMDRTFDHGRASGVIRPAHGTAGRLADACDGGKIGLGGRGRIGRHAMQKRDVGCTGGFERLRGALDLLHRRHAGREHDRLAGACAGFEEIAHQKLVGRDLVERDERAELFHGFDIERCAGKLDAAFQTAFGQGCQMRPRQFPFAAGTVFGAPRQDFRRKHPIDLEQLEFDGIAARIGCGIDERQRTGQIAPVIAGRFGDEDRRLRHA